MEASFSERSRWSSNMWKTDADCGEVHHAIHGGGELFCFFLQFLRVWAAEWVRVWEKAHRLILRAIIKPRTQAEKTCAQNELAAVFITQRTKIVKEYEQSGDAETLRGYSSSMKTVECMFVTQRDSCPVDAPPPPPQKKSKWSVLMQPECS